MLIHLRLEGELVDRLKEMALAEDRSMSKMGERLLKEAMQARGVSNGRVTSAGTNQKSQEETRRPEATHSRPARKNRAAEKAAPQVDHRDDGAAAASGAETASGMTPIETAKPNCVRHRRPDPNCEFCKL